MTKADLKTGMVLVTRNGERYRVFRDVVTRYSNKETSYRGESVTDVIVSENGAELWDYLDIYDDNLRYVGNHFDRDEDADVVSIEMVHHPYCLFHRNWAYDQGNEVIYPKKPRYTYDELKAIVGHDFEFAEDAASCG